MRITLAVIGVISSVYAGHAKTEAVESGEALLAIPVNVTGIYSEGIKDGWRVRSAYYKAPGDNLEGDPGFYMYPLTTAEQEAISEAEGVYNCYRRDRERATKGKFQFGRYPDGTRYSRVDREKQLEKGLSGDAKVMIEAGKVVAAIVAMYTGDPEAYAAGSEGWENFVGTVNEHTDFSKRLDMTPTIIDGGERWTVEGRFSLTVKRYYNCWVAIRFKTE